jgi:regulation of enolase protein 1 (concanavalin A-like superfamily)
MTETVTLAPLSMPLRWELAPVSWKLDDGPTLTISAGAQTDMFVNPSGGEAVLNAPRLLGPAEGDFMLSARVTVDFGATYDAGVLLLYGHEREWGKLCFEYSPQGQPMVVSVVTHGFSDDANAFVVAGNQVWLRVARMGPACAFHASTDGRYWQMIRHFALQGPLAAGFVSQSPTGPGCTATFDQIAFAPTRLAELRDGS